MHAGQAGGPPVDDPVRAEIVAVIEADETGLGDVWCRTRDLQTRSASALALNAPSATPSRTALSLALGVEVLRDHSSSPGRRPPPVVRSPSKRPAA